MVYFKQFISDLITEVSYRTNSGIVDFENPDHISILSEVLDERGLSDIKHELFQNLFEAESFSNPILNREIEYVDGNGKRKRAKIGNLLRNPKESPGRQAAEKQLPAEGTPERDAINKELGSEKGGKTDAPSTDTSGGGQQPQEEPQRTVQGKAEFSHAPDVDNDEEAKQTSDSVTKEEKEEFNNSLDTSISELREKRRTGDAGAGGQAASYGESVYSDNVTSLNLSEFQKKNEKEIQTEVEVLEKKKLNKEQKLVLQNMGYSITPPDKDGLRYLAARKVFFNQKLEEAKADKGHVYHQDPGFKGNPKSFESWCNAAFDGGISTRELLEEGNEIDTSKPYKCVQSDPSVDKKVLAELQKRQDNAKSDEERKHYEREIYFFKKSGTYHDTYVVGEDSKGRMTIVSVTNKAASDLKDPHNNTTPANRLSVLEGRYDKKTQQVVIGVIQEGIERVSNVTEDTKKNSAKIEVDESFAKLARIAGPKYFKNIDKRGTNRKKTKAGGPARGAEFGHFLDEENVSVEDWNSMSDVEKLKLVQKYNANNDVAYDPFAKLFIKVGEVNTGGHNQLIKVRAEAEKQGIDLSASNIKEAGDIKRNEQGAVKETHEKVVKTIYDSDKDKGYPKTDGNGNVVENGPAARAYIDTVLDALHFTSYIDFDDNDDDKLIAQMGIRGAKPSDIRKCLSDLSGYGDIPPGTREGLKEYLRNTSTIDVETGAIIIKSKKNGQDTQLAEDTWRTAGTSQKVASSFGKDMQDCVASKVDSRRSSK